MDVLDLYKKIVYVFIRVVTREQLSVYQCVLQTVTSVLERNQLTIWLLG